MPEIVVTVPHHKANKAQLAMLERVVAHIVDAVILTEVPY